ncbi:putative nuclease HARBI1 isoform X2 [Tanacetum coccineum]
MHSSHPNFDKEYKLLVPSITLAQLGVSNVDYLTRDELEQTARTIDHLVSALTELYGEVYLRRPRNDVEKPTLFTDEQTWVSEWAVLMKSISQPGLNDVKRIRYKQVHEAARKDAERAFGVLKKKWAIVRTLARSRSLNRITHLMYTCIILHNMIRKEKGKAISPDFYRRTNRED